MKFLFVLIFSFFIIKNTATAQTNYGSLEGKMIDKETEEGLIAASIILYQEGKHTPITGSTTDINGNFSIDSIPIGVYDMEFSYVGYKPILITKIEIKTDNELVIIGKLEEGQTINCSLEIMLYCPPIISFDDFGTGRVYTSSDIQNMPIKW